MPATQFAVRYSQTTGRVRSWINFNGPSEGDSLLSTVVPAPGEAVATFPISQYGDLPTIQSLVNGITGMTPSGDRYAIIDPSQVDANGNQLVVGALICDPDGCGDSIPEMDLVVHPDACVGWTYTAPVKNLSLANNRSASLQQVSSPAGIFNPPYSPPALDAPTDS